MYDHKIHYCFILSEEQMKYLRSKKYKIDRMECFMSLVELAERETKLVQVSKTQQVEILPGQVMVDNTQLAKLWNKDRKTVHKLIEAMETLGISSSQKVGDNRIHTLHAFSGWYVDTLYKMTHFSQIPYYKPAGKLISFEKSALLDWVRKVKVKSEDEIREEAALHLSGLSVPRSERTHHV